MELRNIDHSPFARANPVTQSGGMRAVAMATPGMALDLSFRDPEMMPAIPPKVAINTSSIVGFVLARISGVT